MNDSNSRPRLLRFGVFEVDLRTGELRKQGLKVKLHGQPFQVLAMLLERPGELLTREEIREKLWPGDTFIDFEQSVNTSIKRLREALGDDAEHPRYIETLPRHGYRFICPVETVGRAVSKEETLQRRVSTSAPEAVATVEAHHPPAPSSERRGATMDSPPGSGGDQGVVEAVQAVAGPAVPARVPQRESLREVVGSEAGPVREPLRRKRRLIAGILGVVVTLLAVFFAFNVAGWRDRLLRRTLPVPKIESIAVLPLENLSGDPSQEYFADGMTEELITNLGKISALRVISRTSVLRFKGTKRPLPEIAKELNVDAVVEGTVLRSGDRVRITANLMHAPTDRHLWAETYERDLHDILALQSDVAQAVAREVKVVISPAESRRLATVRSVKPEAYELYLKGRYHYYKWTPDDFRKAIGYFQKAVDADPGWAPAYAGLATTYGWLWIEGALPPQEALPRFEAAMKTALAIDDSDPEVRYALAASAFYYRWDWEEADREFQRALALDPNLVEARFEYAWFLASMGRFPAAVAEAERAVECDPLSVSANLALGDVLFRAHQDDRGIAQLRRTAELDPNDMRAHWFLIGRYGEKQMYGEAISEFQKVVALRGAPPEKLAGLQYAYQQSGPEGFRRWQLAEAKRGHSPFEIALAYARLGDAAQAVAWLEKAYQQHSCYMHQLKAGRTWDPIRSDPRFQDLVRRMNFPP